ncbi:Sec62/63 complex, subunit Sec66, partial [Vararia minispora EC-137]
MASVLVPVIYLVVIVGGLLVFGRFYKGRHAVKGADPYFPRHIDRDIYVSLIGQDPPAPDTLLKGALLRRAMTDVHRIIRIREDKPALQQLLQKGLIGEDLWNSLLAAEKELETEILEVQAEANTFVEGWGSIIFNSASELVGNEKIQAVFRGVPKMRAD